MYKTQKYILPISEFFLSPADINHMLFNRYDFSYSFFVENHIAMCLLRIKKCESGFLFDLRPTVEKSAWGIFRMLVTSYSIVTCSVMEN